MDIQDDLKLIKPVSVWNRPLKIDPKTFLFKLAKAATKGVQGDFEDAGENLAEALLDVETKEKAGHLAWLLIYRALTNALKELLDDSKDLFPETDADDAVLENLTNILNDHLLNLDVSISEDFFQYPQRLPLLSEFGQGMKTWLEGLGLSISQAQSLVQRLPDKFALTLHSEWLKNADLYSDIKTAIDSPFRHAAQKKRQWLHYQAWLREQVNQRMFAEAFSLKSVYVRLRGYYEEDNRRDQDKISVDIGRHQKIRHVVDLYSELENWVRNYNADDCIRMLSGGPGSGKSSFCKMFATEIAETTGIKVLFIPLHQFNLSPDLIVSVEQYVSQIRYLDGSPLHAKNGEDQLLVIFDGLDELSMQGKAVMQASQDFVEEVIRKFESFKSQDLKRQVIISGRDFVVQINTPKLRVLKQIYYILPYLVESDETIKYVDTLKLLDSDQRQDWWAKYGSASGKGYTKMPKELRGNSLSEITRWPLLNYLVALSFDRKKLNFDETTSLNLVYQDLLAAVYERQYEKGRIHQGTGGLGFPNFCRILEEIALAVWHGDGRTATVEYIQSRCTQSSLQRNLEEFQDGAAKGITRLLTAFYFRQSGEIQGEKTFEFTHKSFGEYLTACRLLRMLDKIQTEMERHVQDPDDGWQTRKALEHWAELCGPTAIDEYLNPFIDDQVALKDLPSIHKWQQTIAQLIESVNRHGMPMEKIGLDNFQEMLSNSRNAEEALLILHSACAYQTRTVSTVAFSSPEAFGTWIHRLRGQRLGSKHPGALNALAFFDMSNFSLGMQDLRLANLRGSILQGANLEDAKLKGADLAGANLVDANLGGANLQGANLQGADLQGANLLQAVLDNANLEIANLVDANLADANLVEANLEDANLLDATLTCASLYAANLEVANLQRAILESANLICAILQGANLIGANLFRANLQGANLQDANLQDANLQDANLQDANLKDANLQGANLQGTNLQGANLQGTNLQGANLQGANLDGLNLHIANS